MNKEDVTLFSLATSTIGWFVLIPGAIFVSAYMSSQINVLESENQEANQARVVAETTTRSTSDLFVDALFEITMGNPDEAVIQIDKDSRITRCTPNTATLFELRVGDRVSDIMRPEDVKKHRSSFEQALLVHPGGVERAASDLQCKGQLANGEWADVVVFSWVVEDGGVAFVRVLDSPP